jgi:Zinc knuckle
VFLIEHIVKYQREKYHERYLNACKWSAEGKLTTDYARDIQMKLADSAAKRDVEILESNHPVYRARVQSSTTGDVLGFIEVEVDVNRRSAKCDCNYYDEMGIACVHSKALLLALNRSSNWCSSRYDIRNYKDGYSRRIPSMVIAGKLSVDLLMAPPQYKRPAGRPAKKRKERYVMRKTNVQRECQACGGMGHYARSCTSPSTEYRYNRYIQSAIEWCEKMQASMIPE